jgi:DNA-3-methyladenine glycosylase I
LLADPWIIRNRAKFAATIQNRWSALSEVPAKITLSDAMSKALFRAGFKFVGSTICYPFM